MIQLVQHISRIGSKTGKKRKDSKKEIYEICVKFNNTRNYETYKSDLAVTMKMILKRDDLRTEQDWEKNTVRFFITHKKAIITKSKEEIELIVKKWREKLKKHMICKFRVDSHIDYEAGIIQLYLK
ncbi:MAG: hypothetical protein J6A04_01350 [Clostridia bacterium]|nr:hypothetical protein [Clostridia bacterium]